MANLSEETRLYQAALEEHRRCEDYEETERLWEEVEMARDAMREAWIKNEVDKL